jgi:N6-L-threonylcarbamoyladenine synthase
MKILKGGKKKNNQAPFEVFGFRLFDKVLYNNEICFIYGRRKSGCFDIRDFDGKNSKNVTYKKLKLIRGKRYPIILK